MSFYDQLMVYQMSDAPPYHLIPPFSDNSMFLGVFSIALHTSSHLVFSIFCKNQH
eukprot:c32910_g1_i1 orf=579-743(+)